MCVCVGVVPSRLYHIEVIRINLKHCEKMSGLGLDTGMTHAGAIALSKQPSKTRRTISPGKFFAVQFKVVMRPHNITIHESVNTYHIIYQTSTRR
jgi:hypothetical protein